jgi:hypothetical protein
MTIIIPIKKILEIVEENHAQCFTDGFNEEQVQDFISRIEFDLENLRGSSHG